MKSRILCLGAGFGGLELCTTLSEALGDSIPVTLIDQADHFVFGFNKLDVMFGLETVERIKHPYAKFVKPGVRLLRETVTKIDPAERRVTTNKGTHDCDFLVIALGADYDVSTTPGIELGRNEFYTLEGATRLRDVLPTFKAGHAVIGVCSAPYKCPPAPSECALMLHDQLTKRGVRDACTITIVNPLSAPVPPSPDTSKALLASFAERGITFMANRAIAAVDEARQVVKLDDGSELPCQLFLGIPKNRAPDVVVATGMTEAGWVTVNPRTLETKHPKVYAIGDLAATGIAKAGLFAEGAAKAVATNIISQLRAQEQTAKNPGKGTCYIEFGDGRVARVEVDFFSGDKVASAFYEPAADLREHKREFGAVRRARWFGES